MSDASDQLIPPPDADLSGRQLGDYRLLRRMGRGAMAEVYLAEQSSLSRQVALKVLKSELAKDATYVQRFQREARAAAALVHANIVQIHEVGRINSIYFIAQEYVQGLNLRQWVGRNGTPDLRLALIIMRQVAAALTKAAEQGIVHRDIKPENIMLTRSGEVKVTDFGLARLAGMDEAVNLTQVGITMGTPLYMSPEQVEGKPLDPRSDLYSLGVTCYQMLAGSPPFDGDTALSVAVQHLKKTPEPLENLRTDLPPALCRVVHKMLAKKPANRYQSPRELLREFHKLQLEYLDEEWPEDLPGLETAGMELTVASRGETTKRLQTLMEAVAAAERKRSGWIRWVGSGIAAFLVCAALAWLTTREAPLLAHVGDLPLQIPPYEHVSTQYIYATQVRTEEAWQAVIEYFSDEPFWVNRANKELARIYLFYNRDQEAMEICKQLAALNETEEQLRAFGLAGQCWILTKQGKYRESALVLSHLFPIRARLLGDPLMWQFLDSAVRKNRSELDPTAAQQWQEWLDKQQELPSENDQPPEDN